MLNVQVCRLYYMFERFGTDTTLQDEAIVSWPTWVNSCSKL